MSFIINRMSNMSIIPPNLIEKRPSELSLNLVGNNSREELFNLKTVEIRNAKRESFHEKKIILLESILTLINIFVISITIFKNFNPQKTYQEEEYDQNYIKNQLIQQRFLILFSVCVVVLNTVKKISQIQLQSQSQQSLQSNHNSFQIKNWIVIVSQAVFYFIHPSYFTKDVVVQFANPPIHLNKVLSCVVYVRFVTILFFLLKISRFYGLRVNRVLSLYLGTQKDFGILYTIKCYLKENGLKSPFIIYLTIILVFPFLIISVGHKFSYHQDQQISNADSFLEAIYDIVITMSTIGYGDLQHQYLIQRVIFILIIVMGSLSSSFFTLTFLNWFKLSEQEEKALRSIKRLSLKTEIQHINNKKIHEFVHALSEFQKMKKNEEIDQKMKLLKGGTNQHKLIERPSMEQNQNLKPLNSHFSIKQIIPKLTNPSQKKYLNQRLYDTRDTFKDFYQRSQLQLSQSIKILIERTLLTNNLLQFYLMRQKNNNKPQILQNSLISDSSETIKSRKRVDDNIKMYEMRLNIIQSTYNYDEETEKNDKSKSKNKIKNQ